MKIVRQYKNSDEDDLRIDIILMERGANTLARPASEHTFIRRLSTQTFYGPASREVDTIEIITDASVIEQSSGDFLYAEWYSPTAICDMSDLPRIGDTI